MLYGYQERTMNDLSIHYLQENTLVSAGGKESCLIHWSVKEGTGGGGGESSSEKENEEKAEANEGNDDDNEEEVENAGDVEQQNEGAEEEGNSGE